MAATTVERRKVEKVVGRYTAESSGEVANLCRLCWGNLTSNLDERDCKICQRVFRAGTANPLRPGDPIRMTQVCRSCSKKHYVCQLCGLGPGRGFLQLIPMTDRFDNRGLPPPPPLPSSFV